MLLILFMCAFLGIEVSVKAESSLPFCPTFKDAKSHHVKSVWCRKTCMDPKSSAKVRGTYYYSEISSVCLSARHAGELSKEGGLVRFNKRSRSITPSDGSTMNDVVSKRALNGKFYFVEVAEDPITKDWMSDVFIIHNMYKNDDLKISCIYDSSSLKIPRKMFRLNGSEYRKATFLSNENILTYSVYKSRNERAFTCKGRRPNYDVTAVVSILGEDTCYVKPTLRGSVGQNFTFNYSCEGRELYLDKINSDREKKSVTTSNYFTYFNLRKEDEGIYAIGEEHFYYDKLETYSAHFQLFVTGCPKGKYNPPSCDKTCGCLNGAECNEENGRCICLPGFNGLNCEQICDLSYFGSKCHLTCSRSQYEGFYNSQTHCKGLLFCMPKPLGCTCYHGFAGKECDQVVDLVKPLPYFAKPPRVTIQGMTASIAFNKWEKDDDGGQTYGLGIAKYEARISDAASGNLILSQPIVANHTLSSHSTTFTVSKGSAYSVKILIHMKDMYKTGRFDTAEETRAPSRIFFLPCQDQLTKEKLTVKHWKSNQVAISIPFRKENYGTEIDCVMNATINENRHLYSIKPNNSSKINFKINVPPGAILNSNFSCQNVFATCHVTSFSTYGDFDLTNFMTKKDLGFTLKKFPISIHHSTTIRLYLMRKDEELHMDSWEEFSRNHPASGSLKMTQGMISKYYNLTDDIIRINTPKAVLAITLKFNLDGGNEVGKIGKLVFKLCPTFSEIMETKYFCRAICFSQEEVNTRQIYGTEIYSKDSSICLSALHAGVTFSNELWVEFSSMDNQNFQGTVRNRIVSKSKISDVGFYFTTSLEIPDIKNNWLTDVYLLHYTFALANNSVMVACLSDDTKDHLAGVYNWNLKRAEGVTWTQGMVTLSSKGNKRIYSCMGKHPISDVTGIFQRADGLIYLNLLWTFVIFH